MTTEPAEEAPDSLRDDTERLEVAGQWGWGPPHEPRYRAMLDSNRPASDGGPVFTHS